MESEVLSHLYQRVLSFDGKELRVITPGAGLVLKEQREGSYFQNLEKLQVIYNS
jgi:hypothetical protein